MIPVSDDSGFYGETVSHPVYCLQTNGGVEAMKLEHYRCSIAVLIVVGFLSLTVARSAQAGTAFTFGYGNKSCKFFLQAERRGAMDQDYLLMVSWIQGYMSSYSMVDSLTEKRPVDILNNISINSVIGWVHDTCASDSRIYVGNAMASLILKLLKAERVKGG